MGIIDNALKASVIVAVALASIAVIYHYTIYIPQRDAALDAARQREAERNEKAKNELEAHAAAQEAARVLQAAAEKYQADLLKNQIAARYERCISNANINYLANWNSDCARISKLELANYNDCVSNKNFAKDVCESIYKRNTKPEDCALPNVAAASHNSDHVQAKNQCLKEFQLGFH